MKKIAILVFLIFSFLTTFSKISNTTNEYEYLKFNVNNFITDDDSIIDLPVNEFSYLKFTVPQSDSNFDELPMNETI